MDKVYDCLIIGGGPAGLSAAINLAQRGKDAVIISSAAPLLSKSEKVTNYLGFINTSGGEMMNSFITHAKTFGTIFINSKVANIYPNGSEFMVNAGGDILTTKSIILATGIAKARPIAGEELLLGRGVSYCATCDGMLYKGKNILVWGQAENSAEEANYLNDIGCKVSFVAAKMPSNLAQGIKFIQGIPSRANGEKTLESVTIGGVQEAFSGLFILRSSIAPASLLPGIELQDGYIKITRQCETNIKGVYAAGDVTGRPLQISKAVGEGLVAALSIAEYLNSVSS